MYTETAKREEQASDDASLPEPFPIFSKAYSSCGRGRASKEILCESLVTDTVLLIFYTATFVFCRKF
jgi:hypothetical protein